MTPERWQEVIAQGLAVAPPSIAAGYQIGGYTIVSQLGAGGMGEVYRARDTKLGRDVAIKILPRLFTADPQRLARFEREARTLASLNHPHIGAIYGLEHIEGTPALVLELVEGDTLAERIVAGPVPLADALAIAAQIADALEAAHDKGIVHRDLKPANIKITPAGVVKVLDFGLAKAATGSDAGPDLTHSPTIATIGATREGTVLGTPAYMSPEQARGQVADKRSDVWAFGCVLFEMLAGHPAFEGNTSTDIFAAVLKTDPRWQRLPADIPEAIRRLLRRCLQKDVKLRLRDVGDTRLDIDDARSELLSPTSIGEESPPKGATHLAVGSECCIAGASRHAGVAQWRDAPGARGALRNHHAPHSRARLARDFTGREDACFRRHV